MLLVGQTHVPSFVSVGISCSSHVIFLVQAGHLRFERTGGTQTDDDDGDDDDDDDDAAADQSQNILF